jgi:hypothetical protein
MSFTILKAAINKLEERQQIELMTEMGERMNRIRTEGERFSLEVHEVGDELRPPMSTIPAYRRRRAALAS